MSYPQYYFAKIKQDQTVSKIQFIDESQVVVEEWLCLHEAVPQSKQDFLNLHGLEQVGANTYQQP